MRFLFEEMNRQRITQEHMAKRAGVNKNTFKDMRTRSDPKLSMIDACFGVLGMKLDVLTHDEQESIDQQRRTFAILKMDGALPPGLPHKSRAPLVK